ncbi:TIGR01457 family HAD-type hydrolase [Fictibacillus sp. KIGAM418]|uniref:Acid sugar phosphatase n=1 Tax=Fictibacillus marinisediminis TaxID=2878389 RepID=A0A9X1XCG6_9BACL|nr:TIGR01457 family HAD-type hydrolase [Fictibacillus marinisediminis]MCK6258337.1 TIGR01457 family HAD-type hydrolase [Fictibacillus marinisediminis]
MKKYKGYLIDLDGTMYRGKERIEEAVQFVQELNRRGLPYLFVTNNSSKTKEEVASVLQNFEIPATSDHVYTTSMATANYIEKIKPDATVYCIGEEGIRQALLEKGFTLTEEQPDFVVMGIDRSINYEKLAIACLAVRNGARFISTNGDIALPTERGLLPGNGSLTSVVAVSTRVEPTFIGKPEAVIMEMALEELGTAKEDTLMIGDNYDTDILAGIRSGLDTLLVHTGVTQKEHLGLVDIQPTYTVNGLDEWKAFV